VPALRIAILSLVLATGGAVASAAIQGFPTTRTDDAHNTIVNARTHVNGDGLVFTPGYERVEGFTSTGWMLVCSAVFWLFPWREPALLAVSIGLAAVSAGALLALVRTLFAASPLAFALALSWLVATPAFWAWSSVSLMDVALFSAVVHGMTLTLVWTLLGRFGGRASLGLAACCAAAVMTRPEAMALVPGVLVVGVLAMRARAPQLRDAVRPFRPAMIGFALTLLALESFRLGYFGYALPNTYYAKVPPSRSFAAAEGLEYLSGFVLDQPLLLLLALPLAGALLPLRELFRVHPAVGSREAAVFAVACVGWMGLLLPLFGGGDHMGSYRMYQPFVHLLVVPAIPLALRFLPDRRPVAATLALAGLVAAGFAWQRFSTGHRMGMEFAVAERGRRLGAAFNALLDPTGRPSIGEVATGGLGYAFRGRVVDLMGLNWTAMGHSSGDRRGFRNHSAFDPEVFWTDPPDVVNALSYARPPRSACELVNPFRDRVLKGIWRTERFREHYAPGTLRTSEGIVGAFFARDWVTKAQPGGLTLLPEHCPDRNEPS
jgi:hypothetical protein